MRRVILICAAALLSLLAAVSCKKAKKSAEMSCVAFEISRSESVADVAKSQVSDFTSLPQSDDFTLSLYNDGGMVWSGNFSDWNTLTPLVCGDYSVVVECGRDAGEGPDKPYFKGEHGFRLTSATPLQTETVTASLANCIVRYEFTDAFKKCFSTYLFAITTGSDNLFAIPSEDGKAVFVDAFKFTLSGSMTGQSGVTSVMTPKVYENLKPGTCYLLRFDASQSGSVVSVSVSFNDSLENIDLGEIELN